MLDTISVTFNALDRCDRCGAQAYAKAFRSDLPSELLFCAHHGRRFADQFFLEGWTYLEDSVALDRLSNPVQVYS